MLICHSRIRFALSVSGFVLFSFLSVETMAESPVYRCVFEGRTEYTNTISESQAKHCKQMSGGNVTVVQAQKPTPAAAGGVKLASVPQQRMDSADQRARDSDARLILEAELKKAESRQTELLKEYNNGEPEKMGPETRNNQKYLDRIADLKASIVRNEGDIAGIRRELGRVPSAGTSTVAR